MAGWRTTEYDLTAILPYANVCVAILIGMEARMMWRLSCSNEPAPISEGRCNRPEWPVEAHNSRLVCVISLKESVVKVLVPVKRVVDYNVKVRAKSDGSGVDIANAKMSMNPFDEIAVEEAVRLKEAGVATEVVVVSAGLSGCQETLRTALALGADRAIMIETEVDLQPLAVAKLLKAVCASEAPGIVICGKQAIDDDANQTGQMLAALMGWAQATFASKLVIAADKASAQVTREVDGGLETLEIKLPAVVTTDLRLNEPRYATLPNIMKAKKKQLDITSPANLGVDVSPRLTQLRVAEPPKRSAGIKVADVKELVSKLKNEAKVI